MNKTFVVEFKHADVVKSFDVQHNSDFFVDKVNLCHDIMYNLFGIECELTERDIPYKEEDVSVLVYEKGNESNVLYSSLADVKAYMEKEKITFTLRSDFYFETYIDGKKFSLYLQELKINSH